MDTSWTKMDVISATHLVLRAIHQPINAHHALLATYLMAFLPVALNAYQFA